MWQTGPNRTEWLCALGVSAGLRTRVHCPFCWATRSLDGFALPHLPRRKSPRRVSTASPPYVSLRLELSSVLPNGVPNASLASCHYRPIAPPVPSGALAQARATLLEPIPFSSAPLPSIPVLRPSELTPLLLLFLYLHLPFATGAPCRLRATRAHTHFFILRREYDFSACKRSGTRYVNCRPALRTAAATPASNQRGCAEDLPCTCNRGRTIIVQCQKAAPGERKTILAKDPTICSCE